MNTGKTRRDRAATAAVAATGLALAGVAMLFCMVLAFALPVFLDPGDAGIFSSVWRPYQGEFGILPMLAGSLLLSTVTLVLAWPLALASVCWSVSRGSGLLPGAFRAMIRLMAAVPTVVYGFAAVFLLTPLVREGLGGSGLCALSAVVMLVLLVLPTMALVMEAALAPRLERLCPGGQALGMTRLELLWHVVLPGSGKTLAAAALLGFGRAAGDTLLPLMLAGNAPQVPQALTDSLRTLTAHMALVTSNEVGAAAYNSLFAAGALLLAVNAAVSLGVRRLSSAPQETMTETGPQ